MLVPGGWRCWEGWWVDVFPRCWHAAAGTDELCGCQTARDSLRISYHIDAGKYFLCAKWRSLKVVGTSSIPIRQSSLPPPPFPPCSWTAFPSASPPLWRMSEICVLLCRRVSGLAANRLFPQAARLRDSLHCWRHHRLLHGGHRHQGSPVDAARQDR